MDVLARLVTTTYPQGDVRSVWTWCPGCDRLHPFRLAPGDERLEQPTFSPSLLVYSSVHLCEGEHEPTVCELGDDCPEKSHAIGHEIDGVLTWVFRDGIPDNAGPAVYGHNPGHTREPAFGPCHSFLRDGRWEFISDSAHHLAGQTVDMVPLPAGWAGTS